MLRAALCGDCPAVRAVAARALGDLALLYGVQALDEHNPSAEGCEPAQAAPAAPPETAPPAAYFVPLRVARWTP